jgi:hypothetical protein
MNKTEQDTLVAEQYAAGLQNGAAIANIVIGRLSFKFIIDNADGEIRQIAVRALAHVLDSLARAGVEKRYCDSFADGFSTGLIQTFYEESVRVGAALGIKQIG